VSKVFSINDTVHQEVDIPGLFTDEEKQLLTEYCDRIESSLSRAHHD
jgi:hypothetical protein